MGRHCCCSDVLAALSFSPVGCMPSQSKISWTHLLGKPLPYTASSVLCVQFLSPCTVDLIAPRNSVSYDPQEWILHNLLEGFITPRNLVTLSRDSRFLCSSFVPILLID